VWGGDELLRNLTLSTGWAEQAPRFQKVGFALGYDDKFDDRAWPERVACAEACWTYLELLR
jgi:hypothetical protein